MSRDKADNRRHVKVESTTPSSVLQNHTTVDFTDTLLDDNYNGASTTG